MRIALCLLIAALAFIGTIECFTKHLPVIGGAVAGGSLGAVWDKKYGQDQKGGFFKKHKGAIIGSVVGAVSGKLGEKAVRKLYGNKDESHEHGGPPHGGPPHGGPPHGGSYGKPQGGELCAHDLDPKAPKPALQYCNSLSEMNTEIKEKGRKLEWLHDGACNDSDVQRYKY